MRSTTHIGIGVLTYMLVNPAAGIPAIAAAAVGALTPDLDHPNSYLTKRVAVLPIFRRSGLVITGLALVYAGLAGLVLLPGLIHLNGQTIIGLSLAAIAFMPHRGPSHSLVGLAAATYVVYSSFTVPLALPFAIGYLTHLIADSVTDSGIPLLYPHTKRYGLPTGIVTGGFRENIIGISVCLILFSVLAGKYVF